jgi:hypothetical protein
MLSFADVLRKTLRCKDPIASMAADLHGAYDGVLGTVVMESGRRRWGKAEGEDGGKRQVTSLIVLQTPLVYATRTRYKRNARFVWDLIYTPVIPDSIQFAHTLISIHSLLC